MTKLENMLRIQRETQNRVNEHYGKKDYNELTRHSNPTDLLNPAFAVMTPPKYILISFHPVGRRLS